MSRLAVVCVVLACVIGGCLSVEVTGVTEGQPKSGEADYSCRYYSFQVEGGKDVSVWLTPLAGDPNLSVKRFDSFGDISNQQADACRSWGSGGAQDEYSSTKSDSYDGVEFSSSGSGAQYYAIGVWGRQDEGHCRFTVLFHSDPQVHIELDANTPQVMKVRADEVVYFSIAAYQQPEDQILISLTDIYGDPDLYVAAKSVFDHPDPDNFNWRKTSLGADVLLITKDTHASHCEDGQCWAKAGENGFAIGVRGYNRDCEFLISAGDASKATLLASGIPSAGMVQSQPNKGIGIRKYKVYLGEESDDADVFLTKKYGQSNIFANRNTQNWPTDSSADHSGVMMDRYSEMVTSTGPGPKTMYISVTTPACESFCYKSLFSVLGHDGQHMTILQSGVEQAGNIAQQGGTNNYKFFYDDPQADVVVTLTRQSMNQDVDLKINIGRAVTGDSSDFEGARWGSEEVTMTAEEIRTKHGSSFRGWIYIQALSYHGDNAGYTIVATSSVNPRSLTYGESINESSTKTRYYEIELQNRSPDTAQVAVSITTYTGSSRIAVAPPSEDGNPSVRKPSYDSTPSSQRFESTTMQYTAPYSEGTWSISVEPEDGLPTSYSILVYTLDDPVEVRTGMPQGGVVKPSLFNYFFFDLTDVKADTENKPNIRVTLTCVGGDADLYLDTENDRPVKGSSWSGEHYGNDEYVIHWEDDRIRSDTLYIGVQGFSAFEGDVSYTITVSLDKSVTTLVTGRATTGSSENSLASYYQFVPNASNYKVVVTLLRGDATVYIAKSKDLLKPDMDSCRGSSKCVSLVTEVDGDGEHNSVITKDMTTGVQGSPVSISVQPRDPSTSISFTIVVTGIGVDGVIRLNPGTVQYGESAPDRREVDVYSLKVDDRSSQKELTVTLSHQRPWVSVCKDTEGPMQMIIGRSYAMGEVTDLAEKTTTVSPVDINVVRATIKVQAGEKYYIGIKTCTRKAGHSQDRIPYSLHYDGHASTPITLGEGDIRPDTGAGVYRYHLNRGRPLTVNIVPCEGHPRACVTDISTNPNPDQCNIALTTVDHPSMDQVSSSDLNGRLHKYSSEVFIKVSGNNAQFSMCVDQESNCVNKMETSKYKYIRQNIKVGLVTDNSISITWPSPTKTDNTPDEGARVKPFISSADSADVPFTHCGLKLMESKYGDLGFVSGTREQQFNGLTPGTEYILSVAVAETNEDGTTSYTPYNALSVTTTGVNPNTDKGKGGHHGGFWSGVGWFLFTVILLVTIGMLIYCIGGCVFKHSKMGARGFEAIPNVDFWREVPEKTAGCLSGLGGLFKKPIPKPSLAQQRPYERMGGGDSEYVPPEL